MTKVDFLKKWAKKAASGGAVEAFERDVETLVCDAVRRTCEAISRGIKSGAKDHYMSDRLLLERIADTVIPATERAIQGLYKPSSEQHEQKSPCCKVRLIGWSIMGERALKCSKCGNLYEPR